MYHCQFEFLVLGAGPWFGHEVASGQLPALEQRHQDHLPALAKHADQPQASRPARAAGLRQGAARGASVATGDYPFRSKNSRNIEQNHEENSIDRLCTHAIASSPFFCASASSLSAGPCGFFSPRSHLLTRPGVTFK